MSHLNQSHPQQSVLLLCSKHQEYVKGVCLFNGKCTERLLCRSCRRFHDNNHLNNYEELDDLLNGSLVNDLITDFDHLIKKADHQSIAYQKNNQYIASQIDSLFSRVQNYILQRLSETMNMLLGEINQKLQTNIELKNGLVLQRDEIEQSYRNAINSNFQPQYVIDDLVQVIFKSQSIKNNLVNNPEFNSQLALEVSLNLYSQSAIGGLFQHVRMSLDKICQEIVKSLGSKERTIPSQAQPLQSTTQLFNTSHLDNSMKMESSFGNNVMPNQNIPTLPSFKEQNNLLSSSFRGNTTPVNTFQVNKPSVTPINAMPNYPSSSFQPNRRPPTPLYNGGMSPQGNFGFMNRDPKNNLGPTRPEFPSHPAPTMLPGPNPPLFHQQHQHQQQQQQQHQHQQQSGNRSFRPTPINKQIGVHHQNSTPEQQANFRPNNFLNRPMRPPAPENVEPPREQTTMILEDQEQKTRTGLSPKRRQTPHKILELFQQVNEEEQIPSEPQVGRHNVNRSILKQNVDSNGNRRGYSSSNGGHDRLSADPRRRKPSPEDKTRSKSEGHATKGPELLEFKSSLKTEHKQIMFGGLAYVAPRGQLVSAGTDGYLEFWDVNKQHKVRRLRAHDNEIFKLVFVEEKDLLVTAGADGTVSVWNCRDSCVFLIKFTKHEGPVFALEYLSDLNLMVSAGEDEQLRLWKLETAEEVQVMKTGGLKAGSLCYMKNIKKLAVGFDKGHINMISISTKGKKVDYTIKGHSGYVLSLAAVETQNLLVSGADDGCIMVWRIEDKKYERLVEMSQPRAMIRSLVVFMNKDLIISNHDDKHLRLWKLSTGENVKNFKDTSFGEAMIALKNKNEIATGVDKEVKLWNLN